MQAAVPAPEPMHHSPSSLALYPSPPLSSPPPPLPPKASPRVAAPVQAPVPVPEAVQDQVNQASGGFVSIVLLPRHVREATLDDLAWTLLTLHDHVHYHVKCFKVNMPA